jgi:hypothetical protein
LRSPDERTRGKAGQRSHEAPLGEESRTFFEKRALQSTCQDSLACGEAEERGQGECSAEELDPDQARGCRTRIARQALCPREAVMRSLRTRQQRHPRGWLSLAGWGQMNLHLLVSEHLLASPAMGSSAPVSKDARGQLHPGADGAAHSPAVASACSCRSTGTALARDSLATFECERHTRAAGCHQLLCGVPLRRAPAQQPSDYTSGRGPAPGLHRQAHFQTHISQEISTEMGIFARMGEKVMKER